MAGKRYRASTSTTSTTSKRSKGTDGRKKWTGKTKVPRVNMQSGGLVGVEKKFFDTDRGSPRVLTAPTDCTGGVVSLTADVQMVAPVQGNSASTREGNKIEVQSVQVSGYVECPKQANQTAGDNATIVSIFLVQDCQTNAAQCTSELMFRNVSALGALAHAPFRNLIYTKRFKVLAKKQITFTPPPLSWDGTNVEQSGIMKPFNIFKKLKMLVNYVGTAGSGGIADIIDNSLHVVAFCNNTDLAPQIAFNSRIRFTG